MSNKTVEAVANISNLIKNVERPKAGISKEDAVKSIEANIERFTKLKEQYLKLYVDNFAYLTKYNDKLKLAKQSHTKAYFTKKVDRYRTNSIDLLSRMAQSDQSINNLNQLKVKILTPAEAPVTEPILDVEVEADER